MASLAEDFSRGGGSDDGVDRAGSNSAGSGAAPRRISGDVLRNIDIHVTIPSHETRRDDAGNRFTMYNIFVRAGDMEWSVFRRYSQFCALHRKLSPTGFDETGG